jgi:aminoglycoside phosphotransferase (APT) family kinase protein
VVPWLSGESAWTAPPFDLASAATVLGRFVSELHRPAPADAPRNPWRGIPLAERRDMTIEQVGQLEGIVDAAAVLRLWGELVGTPPWPGPPMWIHGDLHPGNLLVEGGQLTAVLDFGDLTAGDPATDLSIAWMWLPPPARRIFRAAAGAHATVDDHTWARARGWALALGLAYLSRSSDDAPLAALARSTIDAVLAD